jgi:mannose-6-phosphate isomerase-like protein (cupin superfamily)
MSVQSFTLTGIEASLARHPGRYHEFVRVPALSAGCYRLAVGETDPQTPHLEDELYYVLRGHATFHSGSETVPVGPGSILFVPARLPHGFQDITEALEVLVVFAPAESAGGGGC